MLKALGHFVTITKHRHRVIANGFHMGIGIHCLRHDLSKYLPGEFIKSAHYYAGDHSPVYEERLDNAYYSSICQHHTRHNKHHYEYWTDFFMGRVIAKRMPYIYATEYVCDVLAASRTYHPDTFGGKQALDYFLKHSKRYFLHDATIDYVVYCLREYSLNGWKNLKRRNTEKIYREISAKYPDVEVFEEMPLGAPLPALKSNRATYGVADFSKRETNKED